jgi:hypothetical protein
MDPRTNLNAVAEKEKCPSSLGLELQFSYRRAGNIVTTLTELPDSSLNKYGVQYFIQALNFPNLA